MKKIIIIPLIVFGGLLLGSSQSQPGMDEVVYPRHYRDWAHVKSAVVGPSSPASPKYEGFTHIYANEIAMSGYRTGNFPDGSVIVFEVLQTVTKAGTLEEGQRKFIDVMMKDQSRYNETGGWGFAEFEKDSATAQILTAGDKQTCFNCHNSRKQQGYVFSSYRQ
jgi:hypothetical protein